MKPRHVITEAKASAESGLKRIVVIPIELTLIFAGSEHSTNIDLWQDMKQLQVIHNPISLEYGLNLADAERPEPAAHEVLIKVHAAGINRADILQAQGHYPPPAGASKILGLEVAGEVVALGSEAKLRKVGDKVCALLASGGYAEYAVAHESLTLPMPRGMDFVQAAAIPEAAFTVYLNLFELGGLAPGRKVLIHGGASGIGTLAIQMASAMGAVVYATAGTAEKAALCRKLGATEAICYRDEDFVSVVKKATGGEGVALVLDMVGGDYFQKNLKALGKGGKLISIALLQGREATLDVATLLMKNITIIGSTLRDKPLLVKHELARSLESVFWPYFENGRIVPVIDSVWPFAEAEKAHEKMLSNKTLGKLVLTPA